MPGLTDRSPSPGSQPFPHHLASVQARTTGQNPARWHQTPHLAPSWGPTSQLVSQGKPQQKQGLTPGWQEVVPVAYSGADSRFDGPLLCTGLCGSLTLSRLSGDNDLLGDKALG